MVTVFDVRPRPNAFSAMQMRFGMNESETRATALAHVAKNSRLNSVYSWFGVTHTYDGWVAAVEQTECDERVVNLLTTRHVEIIRILSPETFDRFARNTTSLRLQESPR